MLLILLICILLCKTLANSTYFFGLTCSALLVGFIPIVYKTSCIFIIPIFFQELERIFLRKSNTFFCSLKFLGDKEITVEETLGCGKNSSQKYQNDTCNQKISDLIHSNIHSFLCLILHKFFLQLQFEL